MQSLSKFIKGSLGVVLALVLAAGVAAAQGAGVVRGQVKDEFGGVVVGATVTLVDATGAEKTATTDEEGTYVFNNVAPGRYTVRAAAEVRRLLELGVYGRRGPRRSTSS